MSLALLAAILLFHNLGATSLLGDEAIYAQVERQAATQAGTVTGENSSSVRQFLDLSSSINQVVTSACYNLESQRGAMGVFHANVVEGVLVEGVLSCADLRLVLAIHPHGANRQRNQLQATSRPAAAASCKGLA